MSDLADSCQPDPNDAGTGETIGTQVTQKRSRPVRGRVYFISCGEFIKIGFSTRPLTRLHDLQTAHPGELEILGTVSGTRSHEAWLHRRFENLHARGEWFHAEMDLLAYIDRHCSEKKAENPELSADARVMLGHLMRLRNAHGHDSPLGQTCSNLIEQLCSQPAYIRQEWAQDERQTLPWLIQQQVKRLADLTALAH